MIFIVGGTARAGKSTLSKTLSRETGINVLDLDHLRWSLAPTLGLDESLEEPSRFPTDEYSVLNWIASMNDRGSRVWRIAERYARAADFNGDDLIVCGIIRPDDSQTLQHQGIEHRAVYLVDTGIADRALDIARGSGENNWQSGWEDHEIERWAHLAALRAGQIIELAEKTSALHSVFDVSSLGYEKAHRDAQAFLMRNV